MRSMTGFGAGEASLGDGRMLLEIRSLNHRYLDVRVRLSPELLEYTSFAEQLARRNLTRGRYDITARVTGSALPPPRLAVDLARQLYRDLGRLRDELAPGTELPLGVIATVPGLFVTDGSRAEDVHAAMDQAFRQACKNMDQMRADEGRHLQQDLAARLSNVRGLTARCAERAAESISLYRTRLRDRVTRLLADANLDLLAARLEQEVVLMADRFDVTEEVSRLGSHFEQFGTLLDATEPAGRRLDFLLQEIARETNTIGAKSQDAGLSHLVVELKSEAERMREQVQNVE